MRGRVLVAGLLLSSPVCADQVQQVKIETLHILVGPGESKFSRSIAGAHSSIGTLWSVLPPGGRLIGWRLGVESSLNPSPKVRMHCALESGFAISSPSRIPLPVFTEFYDFAYSPGLPLRDSFVSLPAPMIFQENVTSVWLAAHIRNSSKDPVVANCVVHLFFLVP